MIYYYLHAQILFLFGFFTICYPETLVSLDSQICSLSLDEKLGQLMMVHFNGETVNSEAEYLVTDCHIGNFIYYTWANGLKIPEQIRKLSEGLQQLASQKQHPIPLLIAVDQEGGRISRLREGFTPMESNAVVGLSRNTELAKSQAYMTGRELKAVGINMNLAPVVDIASAQAQSYIGDRSFGNTPEFVISFAKKAIQGYREAGIISTLKHFPGHGDVTVDSHKALPCLLKNFDDLWNWELRPFAELAPEADVIMTAHMLIPALDAEHCSTLSAKTITILREKLGFKGVVLTDSLVMKGLSANGQTIEEIAIQAINAGCDMLLLGGKLLDEKFQGSELSMEDISEIHQALKTAVQDGRILQSRIDEAASRVLNLKSGIDQ